MFTLATRPGWYSAHDVQDLIGVSAATVYRDLTWLCKAEMAQRCTGEGDRSHQWLYAATEQGCGHISETLGRAGLQIPANLGLWAGAAAKELLVLLSATAHYSGVGQLMTWRSGLDAAIWLRRQHGIDGVQVDAYGVWAEGDRAIRFLVLVDGERERAIADRLLDRVTGDGGRVLPVHAILLITDDDAEERFIHERLRDDVPHVIVATTTPANLFGREGPAGAIWSTGTGSTRRRLIDLTLISPSNDPMKAAPRAANLPDNTVTINNQ
ncbi:hypothetical protein [Rhizocola hellebori]|uniref:hypothetical protein n=1 Tax=Rhizocola hellebori TaxID=1392758 RepID=UPI001942449C|nr:hypothetical protein [Rhizocola hellebori]